MKAYCSYCKSSQVVKFALFQGFFQDGVIIHARCTRCDTSLRFVTSIAQAQQNASGFPKKKVSVRTDEK